MQSTKFIKHQLKSSCRYVLSGEMRADDMTRKNKQLKETMALEPMGKTQSYERFRFQCDKCPYVDKTAFLLECHIEFVHQMKVEKERVKVEKCPSCSYQSPYPKLLRHMKTHTQFPLQCGFCDFQSNTKDDMHSHIYKVHTKLRFGNLLQTPQELEVAYRDKNGALFCTCGGQFKKPDAMLRHQIICQNIVIPSEMV